MINKGVTGVIFDWAGTTVDYGCMAPTYALLEVFKKWNIYITIEEARESMGLSKKDHIKAITRLDNVGQQWQKIYDRYPDEIDINELYSSLEPSLVKSIGQYSTLIPGTVELVNALILKGIKIGATSGYTDKIMNQLIPMAEKQGYKPDCIIDSSQVTEGRPKPWMAYLNAIQLNIYPLSTMIKIGDTVADIQEGLNAGMWVIGITKSGNEVGVSQEETETIDSELLKNKIHAAKQKLLAAGAHYIAEGVWECLPILEKIDSKIRKGMKP